MTKEQIQALKAADPKRIAACVKACEGISTDNLTNNVPLKQGLSGLNQRIRALSTHRDELLAERDADKALIAEQAKRIAELENKHCGGSLMEREEHHVGVVNKLLERIAELEDRTLAVKLPKVSTERQNWTTWDWIQHLGGRYQNGNPEDYIEFGSVYAVEQMLKQFSRTVYVMCQTEVVAALEQQLAAAGITLVVEE